MFVTKLNPTGSALGVLHVPRRPAVDNGERVPVDGGGNAYVMGFTSSTDFPTTAGAFDTTANGGFDATLTKLNPAGSALVYSTYLGGNDFDGGSGLVVDGAGNAYVAGGTPSAELADDARRVRHDLQQRRRVRHEVQPGRLGAGVLDVHRRLGLRLDQRRRPRPGGQRVADGRHELGRLPGHRRRARHDVQRRRRRDHRRAQRHRLGAALLDLPRRLATRRAAPTSPAIRPATSTSPASPTRRTSRPPSARSTGSGTATSQIFWGDAFVTKIDIDADDLDAARAAGRAGRADAGVAVQRLVAAAADHVRLERRRRSAVSYTHPDRRLERVHALRWCVTQSVTHVDLRDDRARRRDPLLAGPRRQLGGRRRARGRRCAASPPQTPPPPAQLSNVDVNPSTVVGGTSSSGTDRDVRRAGRRRGDLAVEQQPERRQRAGDDHGAGQRVHGLVRRHDVGGRGLDDRS